MSAEFSRTGLYQSSSVLIFLLVSARRETPRNKSSLAVDAFVLKVISLSILFHFVLCLDLAVAFLWWLPAFDVQNTHFFLNYFRVFCV